MRIGIEPSKGKATVGTYELLSHFCGLVAVVHPFNIPQHLFSIVNLASTVGIDGTLVLHITVQHGLDNDDGEGNRILTWRRSDGRGMIAVEGIGAREGRSREERRRRGAATVTNRTF